MKKIVIAFVAVFCMCFLGACAEVSSNGVPVSSNEKEVANKVTEEAIVDPTAEPTAEPTPEPTAEPTPEPTAEPTPEPTPEPTIEPDLYPGIDMESDLKGIAWIETFEGIITEPKVVIFSDETGRKEIVQEGTTVLFNPDKDVLALYFPGDWRFANKCMGPRIDWGDGMYYHQFGIPVELLYFEAEDVRSVNYHENQWYFKNDAEEEIVIEFTMKSE